LDAGCGSGIVSRYLAKRHPTSTVTGCDASTDRVEQARKAASNIKNLSFQTADLRHLPFRDTSFDAIVCRYVLQHLGATASAVTVRELVRCLAPGRSIVLIDCDGFFHNLYPQPPLVKEVLMKFMASGPVDLDIGRKLPHLLRTAGIEDLSWRIETIECQGTVLEHEAQLTSERLAQAAPALAQLLQSEARATAFTQEYLAAIRAPGAVLFYNKFIVTGKKPQLTRGLSLISPDSAS
jgi:ubiquinone/menaquinone biosynthesis C-methylase UbiE